MITQKDFIYFLEHRHFMRASVREAGFMHLQVRVPPEHIGFLQAAVDSAQHLIPLGWKIEPLPMTGLQLTTVWNVRFEKYEAPGDR